MALWLINKYFLYKYGVTLAGADFKTLTKPVAIADVQKACARDLLREWVSKINDPAYLKDSHQQSYVVLNLCRILHTVTRGKPVSKKDAVAWAKKEYPQWVHLIADAAKWHYGVKMTRQKDVIGFIKFAAAQVKTRNLAP